MIRGVEERRSGREREESENWRTKGLLRNMKKNTESTSSSASSIAENEVEQDPIAGPSQEEIPQKSAVITPSLAASLDRNKGPD